MNDNSPSELRAILQQRGLALKKRFGQNFLIHAPTRIAIVQAAERLLKQTPSAPTVLPTVWEVGPGLGALTAELLAAPFCPALVCFEVDQGFVAFLRERFAGFEPARLRVVPGDFAKSWFDEQNATGPPQLVCGNLPYSVAGTLIGSMVESPLRAVPLLCMVQAELAERIAAGPGTKAYGAFSVLVQLNMRPELLFRIPGGAFYPVPEVESAMIQLLPRPVQDAESAARRTLAARLARTAFAQRRKQIGKTLAPWSHLLGSAGIQRSDRPETVTPEQFLSLARSCATADSLSVPTLDNPETGQ